MKKTKRARHWLNLGMRLLTIAMTKKRRYKTVIHNMTQSQMSKTMLKNAVLELEGSPR